MRFLRVGPDAVLVECRDLTESTMLRAALASTPMPGMTELIPGARTVLVCADRRLSIEAVQRHVASLELAPVGAVAASVAEIEVIYDGEDLTLVADMVAMSPQEVIRRHSTPIYEVAFTGFSPGFAYLSGGDPLLDVPRKSTPRTQIPAGAVAIAGEFTGIYPRASPGGWQLLGHTDVAMWDLRRDPPAVLQPGGRVRFVPAREQVRSSVAPSSKPVRASASERGLEIVNPGPLMTVQDAGRHAAHFGVTGSGAMDRPAWRAANRLVGNVPGAATAEFVYGPIVVRAREPMVVAVTGACRTGRIFDVEEREFAFAPYTPVSLRPGDELELDLPAAGVYSYLAVRGGLDVEPALGSAATDTLAALGPAPLRIGEVVAVRRDGMTGVVGRSEADAMPDVPLPGSLSELDVMLGPRDDWFTDEAVETFLSQEWEVTAISNRVGLRLRGSTALTRCHSGELASEATLAGAVQVPADGQPVLFAADHPVTGGYPVIACLTPRSLARAVQVPAGARIRFRAI